MGQETALDLASTFGSFDALWSYLKEENERRPLYDAQIALAQGLAEKTAFEQGLAPSDASIVDSPSATTINPAGKKKRAKKSAAKTTTTDSSGHTDSTASTDATASTTLSDSDTTSLPPEAPPIVIGSRLKSIYGMGDKAVAALLDFAADPRNRDLVEGLMKEGGGW